MILPLVNIYFHTPLLSPFSFLQILKFVVHHSEQLEICFVLFCLVLFCFLAVVPSSVTTHKCMELSWRSDKNKRWSKCYIGQLNFILTLSPKFLCVCGILGVSLKSCCSQVVPNCLCVFQFCYLLGLVFCDWGSVLQ